MNRPCLRCGRLLRSGSRCPVCDTTKARGYTGNWRGLSRLARQRQPWCTDCRTTGTTTNPLTADHLRWPATSLEDVEVVCMSCNNRRGPARQR